MIVIDAVGVVGAILVFGSYAGRNHIGKRWYWSANLVGGSIMASTAYLHGTISLTAMNVAWAAVAAWAMAGLAFGDRV